MPQRVATMVVPDDQGGYFIVVRVEDESRRTKAYATHGGRTVIQWDSNECNWVSRPGERATSGAEFRAIEDSVEALGVALSAALP